MLRFVLLKIKNKYKLYLCLLVGIAVMTAMFTLMPMYESGASERMLQDGFKDSYESEGRFPAVLSRKAAVETKSLEETRKKAHGYENTWNNYLKFPKLNTEYICTLKGSNADTSYRGKGGYMDIVYIEDGDYEVVDGVGLDDDGAYEDLEEGVFPCVISEYMMDAYDLVTGEEISFYYLKDSQDNSLKLKVVGIVREKSFEDYFWQKSLSELKLCIIVDDKIFDDITKVYEPVSISYEMYEVLDYRYINPDNADSTLDYLTQFHENDEALTENITDVLKSYNLSKKSIKVIVYVITVPLFLLIIIFISMLSVRIVDSEKTEIAALHSRGLSKAKIIRLYIFQTLIIEAVALPVGILLGYILCKAAGRVDGFLSFHGSNNLYFIDYRLFIYVAVGALLSGLCMIIPVFGADKETVVSIRHRKMFNIGSSKWEKYFLDMLLLLISSYLIYDFNRQLESMRSNTLQGKGLEPLIFITSTVFMIAVGLIFVRLLYYLIKLIYSLGKQSWKSAEYAAMLQILRNRKKTDIISVFMVITVASSIFNANIARTINQNNYDRINYNVGTDIIIREKWRLIVNERETPHQWKYTEPDYELFHSLVAAGLADSVTRVIRDDGAEVEYNTKRLDRVTLLGINTKEFGSTAYLKDGLNDIHWFNYLNALAQTTNGAIISKNMAEELDIEVGASIVCYRFPPSEADDEEAYAKTFYEVVGIVDAFPGYESYGTVVDENDEITETEKYLLVVNYTGLVNIFGMTPYEVWIRSGDSRASMEYIEEGLGSEDRKLETYTRLDDEIEKMRNRPVLQVTNGLFTINFILSVILSILGLFIFRTTEVRDRQTSFGIYRAMGISVKEINRMLLWEVLGISLTGIIAGALSGGLTTVLFIDIFATVYLPERHNIPLDIYVDANDMIRLGIIFISAFVISFVIIKRIIRNLRITEVLKLGED